MFQQGLSRCSRFLRSLSKRSETYGSSFTGKSKGLFVAFFGYKSVAQRGGAPRKTMVNRE